MTTHQPNRTNDEWLADLRGAGPSYEAAIVDLRHYLIRGLGYALSSRSNVRSADIEDFVQEALLKILGALDSFRGESRFTTWAQKIAVRTAFSELRRRRWRDVSLDEMTEGIDGSLFIPMELVDPDANAEQQATQRLMMDVVRSVIDHELTDKQRYAMVSVLINGMPAGELAERTNSSRNAVYKLIHDARQKMQREMLARGLDPQAVLAAFST